MNELLDKEMMEIVEKRNGFVKDFNAKAPNIRNIIIKFNYDGYEDQAKNGEFGVIVPTNECKAFIEATQNMMLRTW